MALLALAACTATASNLANSAPTGTVEHSYTPPEGFVPTSEVAVGIATAVLGPIYGSDRIQRQLPLIAHLEGDRWIVEGSHAEGTRGGVARIEIARADGCILRVTHGR